jgi:hypothetical protein
VQALASIAVEQGRLEDARAYQTEAIAAAEEVGASRLLSFAESDLAVTWLLLDEFDEAALLARKALVACRRLGNRRRAAFAVFVLACCTAASGDYSRAAQLTGAHDVIDAAVLRDAPNRAHFWTDLEQARRDDNRNQLRHLLGADDFERLSAVGAGLSFDEAADMALGKVVS